MLKLTKTSVAVLLAMATIAASAQNLPDQSDMFGQFGQPTPNVGNAAVVPPGAATSPRRVTITNTTSPATTPIGAAAGANGTNMILPGNTATSNVLAPNGVPAANMAPIPFDQANGLRGLARQGVPALDSLSEFQKFIFDSTGKVLPIFGSQFFLNSPNTFAPILNSPVPSDYLLGAGDELLIRGWGTVDIDYRATVDRNGTVTIPTIGSIVLAGVRAGEAESIIRGAIGKLYKGVSVSVNFGQLRAITVYVVGQANRPGTYTVSSLSTLVTALFASGGPNANGSMRRVQVKRAGKVVGELDLYAFIAKGDKSGDIKLHDGDSIYIPPAGGYVALVGKVNTPAIYELKNGNDTVESLLDVAGGLPVVADPRRAYLERIDPSRSHPRSIDEFALNPEGLKRPLKNGDVLNITSITPDFANAVVLRGNVDQPLRMQFKQGMRVSDLIPSKEYLITRNATKRQNSVVVTGNAEHDTTEDAPGIASQIGGMLDEINWDYAVIERVNRADLSVKLIPFNLGKVFADPNGPDNPMLQPGDTVTVFSQQDVQVPMEKRRVFVRVEGEVRVPGVYQMTAGDTLQSLLSKAGGPTSNAYLFGTAFYREEVRKQQEVNLEKAANRLETQLRSEQSKSLANEAALNSADAQLAVVQRQNQMRLAQETLSKFRQMKPSGRVVFGLSPNERSFAHLPQVKLENGDRLVVPAKPAYVHVFGAVSVEASPLWNPNSRVKDYLDMAGLTPEADVDNAFVMRIDGSVVSGTGRGWFSSGIGGVEIMPGDSIVVPEKLDKETAWTKFTQGTREWAQIFANFGLGAAAVKTLRD
jgi:protein involved in polysaccharide export with SLBB domain